MDQRSLFEGDLVVFTAIDIDKDTPVFSSWSLHPEFVSHFLEGVFRPYSSSEIKKKFKEDLKKADETRNHYYFAIREKEGERLVGLLRFGWVQATNQYAALILDFESDETAEKYFEEALQMALRYGFMELSLHRLYLEIPACNETDIKRYEAAGFLRESQRREAAVWDGKFYDLLLYAILKPEWKNRMEEVRE